MVEVKLNVTPKRKISNDHANTPVPGCINGSCVENLIKSHQNTDEIIRKKSNINQNGSADAQVNSQVNQVMKNMQTVLEFVLLEIHQSKEDNLKFKPDVSNQLHDIFSHQRNLGDSLVAISKDFPTGIHKLWVQYESHDHAAPATPEI